MDGWMDFGPSKTKNFNLLYCQINIFLHFWEYVCPKALCPKLSFVKSTATHLPPFVFGQALVDPEVEGELSDLFGQDQRLRSLERLHKVPDARLGQRVVQLCRVVVGRRQVAALLSSQGDQCYDFDHC
jgi:hypothetical protein